MKQDLDAVRGDLMKKLFAPDISKEQIDKALQAISSDNAPAAIHPAEENFSSIKDICRFTGLSRVTIWRLCGEKRLNPYVIGRRKLFRLSEVSQAIRSGAQE